MSNSNSRRFVRAAWSLLSFQLIASIGAAAVTAWAAFVVSPRFTSSPVEAADVNDGSAVVTVAGDLSLGQTLVATVSDDPDGGPTSTRFQWRRDGAPIPGATAQSYTLAAADERRALTVGAEYDDGEGHGESVESRPVLIPPFNNGPGTLTLSLQEYNIVATLSDPDGVSETPRFQWFRDGSPMLGVTGNTYYWGGRDWIDSGHEFTARADYRDSDGFSGSAVSQPLRTPTVIP